MQLPFCVVLVVGVFNLIWSTVTAAPSNLERNPQSTYLTPDPSKPIYWFSFGDSYTATGFVSWGALPSVDNPLGNPRYRDLTFSEGANWVEYLTTTYNQTSTLTYNLAVASATINASLVLPVLGVSLEDQVNTYLEEFSQKPESTPWESSNTLFSIWIGINDIGRSYSQPGDRDAFSDVLLDSYFNLVEQLLVPYSLSLCSQSGARLFLFTNVPPIDRSPLMLQFPESHRDKLKAVIQGYNDKLQGRINAFEDGHTDVQTWLWDSHTAVTAILDDPTWYGFQDATSYGFNPTYFWLNDLHPGSAAHRMFAQDMRDTLDEFPW